MEKPHKIAKWKCKCLHHILSIKFNTLKYISWVNAARWWKINQINGIKWPKFTHFMKTTDQCVHLRLIFEQVEIHVEFLLKISVAPISSSWINQLITKSVCVCMCSWIGAEGWFKLLKAWMDCQYASVSTSGQLIWTARIWLNWSSVQAFTLKYSRLFAFGFLFIFWLTNL